MANFATAALVKAQAKLIGKFQAGELRFRDPAVHKLFLRNTTIMIPDYEQLRTREDRTVETNYFLRTSRALGTGRSHNHTGAQGDSGVLTPAWTTYNDKFVTTIKEADNKVYSFDELHMSKMENVVANFAEGLEAVAAAYLFANRSGVNVATAEGTFNATDDAFEITESTNGNRAIQITRMVMDINKYQGTSFDIVCDSIAFNKFQYDAAQGISNATNTSFQFMNVTFVHDPSLTAAAAGLAAAYSKGFWIAVPTGTIAALPWIPIQNRQGVDYSPVASYGQISNPVDGVSYAIHTYQEGADGTSVGGFTQDVKIETEISVDIAYEHAPLSVAGETTLMAFALV
jgi:hypothetical protein